jgi:hypothetical protein
LQGGSYAIRSVVVRRTGFDFESWASLGLQQPRPDFPVERGLTDSRRRLHRICQDPRFLEAVLLSSSDAHDRLRTYGNEPFRERRDAETRRRERLAAAYLQRLCARCETTSFFGPFGWTRLGKVSQIETTEGSERRFVLPSIWAVEVLRAAGAVPDAFHCALEHLGLTPYPERVQALAELRRTFETLCGIPARRGAGKMYADRDVFVEECLDVGVPPLLPVEPIRDALRVIDGIASRCQDLASRMQADARSVLSACFPSEGRVSATAITRDCSLLRTELVRHAPELVRRGQERAKHAFPEFFCAVEGEQHAVDLQEIPQPLSAPPGACDAYSPDILIAARDAVAVANGHFFVVLGEIHSVPGVFGHYLDYHPRPHMMIDAWDMLAKEASDPICFVARPRNRSDVLYPPGSALVLSEDRGNGIALQDLEIERNGNDLLVRAPGLNHACLLPSGRLNEASYFPWGIFTRPGFRTDALEDALLRVRSFLPRISVQGTVIFRRTWLLSKQQLHRLAEREGTAMLRAADALRAEKDIPRWVFLRGDTSPKPIAVDLESPLALEVAAREVRRARCDVTIREMLPEPEDLWYRIGGRRRCLELRATVFRIARKDGI